MAATHIAPVLDDRMSIREGVAFLSDTGYPVTYRQLARDLAAAGAKSERRDRTDYYSASDVLEVHRDRVDRMIATQ